MEKTVLFVYLICDQFNISRCCMRRSIILSSVSPGMKLMIQPLHSLIKMIRIYIYWISGTFLYEVIIIRNPSSPLPLHSHSLAVNAFAWSPVSSQYLVSVGEDAHVGDSEISDVIVFYMGF